MLQLTDHYLSAIIMFKRKKEKQSSYQFEKCLQNMIAMHAGKSCCAGKHGGWYKTNFITVRPVLAFQTWMLATLNKWATTHERVFSLGKDYSWTLLPGSTWLQTLITRFYQLHSKLQNTICLFKTCWWLSGLLRLYDASKLPGRYTCMYKVLKRMLKMLVDRVPMHHISFFFDGVSFDAQSTRMLCFTSQ